MESSGDIIVKQEKLPEEYDKVLDELFSEHLSTTLVKNEPVVETRPEQEPPRNGDPLSACDTEKPPENGGRTDEDAAVPQWNPAPSFDTAMEIDQKPIIHGGRICDPSFFDDLIREGTNELQRMQDEEEDIKYSEKLKQLTAEFNALDKDETKDDSPTSGKKHKKRKKKHKNKDKAKSPHSKKRRSNSPEKKAIPEELMNPEPAEAVDPFMRATAALQIIDFMEYQGNIMEPFGEFNYTPTVWRDPKARPDVNRNVEIMYSFQTNSAFDLQKYDSSISFQIPERFESLTKALGLNIHELQKKLQKLESWPPIKKKLENVLKSNKKPKTTSQNDSILTHLAIAGQDMMPMSQPIVPQKPTIAVRNFQPEIAVSNSLFEPMPPPNCVATQVNFTNTEDGFYSTLKGLPMMKLMQGFNEHQLLAMNDFAELIGDPDRVSNAMDLFTIRKRLMDIYNSSQMQSITHPIMK